MKKLVFPTMKADDIEVRVGNYNKDRSKMTLLLYKTARVDAYALDNHDDIGAFNWQSKFTEVGGKLFCEIGIYCAERGDWIWKGDCGSEGDIEKEKSLASDCFKRAGFKWGIGRELYSAPTIWVDNNENYTNYSVKEISYDENRKIKSVVIVAYDKTNKYEEVQVFPKVKATPTKASGVVNRPKITETQVLEIEGFLLNANETRQEKFYNYLEKKFNTRNIKDLEYSQANDVIKVIGDLNK